MLFVYQIIMLNERVLCLFFLILNVDAFHSSRKHGNELVYRKSENLHLKASFLGACLFKVVVSLLFSVRDCSYFSDANVISRNLLDRVIIWYNTKKISSSDL